jgi:hypothetical protein
MVERGFIVIAAIAQQVDRGGGMQRANRALNGEGNQLLGLGQGRPDEP